MLDQPYWKQEFIFRYKGGVVTHQFKLDFYTEYNAAMRLKKY
jgi:hypothetical protein